MEKCLNKGTDIRYNRGQWTGKPFPEIPERNQGVFNCGYLKE